MKKIFLLTLLSFFMAYPLSAQERGTREEAVSLVNKFIDYFNKYGEEKALAEVQNPNGEFRVKDLYIFVNDDTTEKMLAHGVYYALVGRNIYNMKDADGKEFMKDFREIFLNEEGEGWAYYKWPHPITGKVEKKETFIKKINDKFYVGCGVSSPD